MKFFEIKVGNSLIGTVHIGTEANVDDDSYIHLNLQPQYHQSGYEIVEVKYEYGRLYVGLRKDENARN
jgi:hypothetical protein